MNIVIEKIGKYYRNKRKTDRYRVTNKKGTGLGMIEWNAGWRRYCFYPVMHTVFDVDCLNYISKYTQELNESRFIKRRKL